jgi:pimeloyl-ACP methyl ester carboxylesterase
MRNSLVLTFLLLSALLTACSSLQPLRTELPNQDGPEDCTETGGKAPPYCSKRIVEVADTYRLHFIEFDDQGRPYAQSAQFGAANQQIPEFLLNVGEATSQSASGVSVVVFVHGWLHSSSTNDSNLVAFRRLLTQLARVENHAFCKRSVIGLYVAWRGAGTVFAEHPIDTLSFWSRKLAAEQIANGSFQQVAAGLQAMQSVTPDRSNFVRGPAEPDCSSRLKTTYVGHSFGGLIVLASMSQDLIRGLMVDQHPTNYGAPRIIDRQGPDELVIAINPAIEGGRLDALFRVASRSKYSAYRAPQLVVVTSQNDWATRTLFPLGRTLNTLTKRYPKGDTLGRDAARTAVGHDKQYLTRTLVDLSSYQGSKPVDSHACDQWKSVSPYSERARLDVERARALYQSVNGEYDANKESNLWPRIFCVSHQENQADDTGLLVMDDFEGSNFDRNVPIWNVTTRKPIVNGHGDIENIRLVEFLRQIYVDTMFFK